MQSRTLQLGVIWTAVGTLIAGAGLLTTAEAAPASAAHTGHIATAGPPLICHEWASLDEIDGLFPTSAHESDPARVGTALIDGLDRATDSAVRMELIRRAVMIVAQDKDAAREIAGRLALRVLHLEAVETNDDEAAAAWLDAGFYAASVAIMDVRLPQDESGAMHGVPGAAWMARALKTHEDDSAMHLALAMSCWPERNREAREAFERHAQQAWRLSKGSESRRACVRAHLEHIGEFSQTIARTK